MRRSRAFLLSSAVAALAIVSVGAPVGAAANTGAIAFVNGSPGNTVDVCVNGREVRSALKYGQKSVNTIAVGSKKMQFYVSSPKTCRGQLLGTKTITLKTGQRQTAVITRKSPNKVVVFRNFIPTSARPAATTNVATLRHAADVGAAYLEWELQNIITAPADPITPAVTPFSKGESSQPLELEAQDPAVMYLQASKAMASSPFSQVSIHRITLQREYEWILVGSSQKNARFIQLSYPLN